MGFCGSGARRGGCLVCRPPTPPLVYFFAPIPPAPFLNGEGGSRLFHARGFAPCIPGIKPLAAQAEPEKQAPGGGLTPALPVAPAAVVLAGVACLFGRLPALPLVFDSAPFPEGEGYPPDPRSQSALPGGKGETKVISCKGLCPLHPRGWVGRGTGVACGKRVTAGGLPGRHWGMVGAHASGGGLAFLVACRPYPEPSLFFIPISRREDRAQTIGFSQYSIFGKSSGGSGGLFQESPSVLPFVSPVPSANAVRRERVRERPSRCMTV